MPSRTQRLVRRRPLKERLQAFVNPMDFYLWLSEEIQTLDWDSKIFGTRFGLAANFIFLLARANSGRRQSVDDVFTDAPVNGWVTFIVNFLVYTLLPVACLNAFYTMTRSRQYRLFEANVEASGPATPSAHRVRVDSAPVSSSPLRLLQDMLGSESAESRAHPDKTRDVWEIAVWDPYPAALRIFCLFSPGHILIYMLFLPLQSLDPRPSVTVFKCLILQVILSTQMFLLHHGFSQQAKDTAIIQREVMHEYDTKYVHPRLHPVVREVAVQVSISDEGLEQESVEVSTPATLIRRGFKTHPNPNYVRYVDPDGGQPQSQPTPQARSTMSPSQFTPMAKPRISDAGTFASQLRRESGLRQSLPSPAPYPTPSAISSSVASTSTGGPSLAELKQMSAQGLGGSLGVFTHKNSPLKHSPLKKATSTGDMNSSYASPRNNREMAALEQSQLAERMVRQMSPKKENRRATTTQLDQTAYMHSPNTAAAVAAARANRWTQERFPTRRL
ncbi:hypothetical protein B0T16DRAFT_431293 [Cercophora newfieldiana]|uniref:Meiotically up-regulated gene 154 protein n=1 Tax=Cercophora newfieldiana TaxID=92897 RepID=A0AA39XWH4_9PEZI|nr:hypothetical protein B0T16DRAFT_431293 [Cercophora newfieldiana]